jgi:hypothetical protein
MPALTSGAVECWGNNYYGSLGGKTPGHESAVPVAVKVLGPAIALGVGGDESCALVEGGQVWCWGLLLHPAQGSKNCYVPLVPGQPDGAPVNCTTPPLPIPGVEHVVALTSARGIDCVLDANGEAWWWGGSEEPSRQVPITRLAGSSSWR